jgi:hypothetical protein
MAEFIITERQLEFVRDEIIKQQNYQLAESNWNNFSEEQKNQIVEILSQFYPEKRQLIKEGGWLNTLGDIVGIFDPTGVVDLINGISYIYQGDHLFGFLSLISAVPYVGDFVAKPVMAALKIGAPSAKALEGVLKLAKAGKTAEATKTLNALVETGGITGKFVEGFSKIAGKLRGYIERVPMGMFKGLKKTILQWFDLFEKAAVAGKPLRKTGQELVKGMAGQRFGNVVVRMNKATQIKKLEELINLTKKTPGLFSGYRTSKGILSWKSVFRGMPQLLNRNASVRALMRQTKWWAGFLDWIGIANFVGPDELAAQIGEDEMAKKMEEYNKTAGAEQNFQSDFGQAISTDQAGEAGPANVGYGKIQPLFNAGAAAAPQATSNSTASASTQKDSNPVKNMFKNMFMGQMNPLPG